MVRELFVMAREHAPSILFMDEAGLDFFNKHSNGKSRLNLTRGVCARTSFVIADRPLNRSVGTVQIISICRFFVFVHLMTSVQ